MTTWDDLEGLQVERRGAVRLVTIDRPDHLNAVGIELHRSFAELWERLAEDSDARAVVLTGRGRAFSAGGDFAYMQACLDSPDERATAMDEARRIVSGLVRLPMPVVAAVNGPAVGLGCSLAILSDIVLAHTSSSFADPHLLVGLAPGDGGAAWPAVVGLLRAKEALLTGATIEPARAVEWGLASRVVTGDVVEEALEVADRLAKLPAEAVQSTKQMLNGYLEQHLPTHFERALEAEARALASPEHRAIVERLIARARSRR